MACQAVSRPDTGFDGVRQIGENMNKLKLFLENFFVYGFGGIISKVIPLIMVPIVTRMMPDSSYFGISDMSGTVVSFGSALAIMGMYDAMYRMFFEKEEEEYKRSICSTAFVFTIFMSFIIFMAMISCRNFIANRFFGDARYAYLVYITATATMVGATNSIVSAPTRMQNKRKVFLVMNTLSPVLSYSVAIPLLLKGYYVVALPVATMVAGLSCEMVFLILNHKWFSLKKVDLSHLKPLLMIGIPLLPNFLIYWIFNSSDKLMITNLIGTAATGIYSVGAKLGHASQLIYTAFAGGWQFFAFSTMKEQDQVESNSRIFEYLGIVSYISTALVFALAEPIYGLLFTGDYIKGYIISPYLFLAPLLQMLFQVACNQFLVVKKTWPNLFILTGGAVVNVVLNLCLIPKMGIEGAAIATLIGYVISDTIAVVVLCRMRLMVISLRFIVASLLMAGFIPLWRFVLVGNVLADLVAAVLLSCVLVILYRDDLRSLFGRVQKEIN